MPLLSQKAQSFAAPAFSPARFTQALQMRSKGAPCRTFKKAPHCGALWARGGRARPPLFIIVLKSNGQICRQKRQNPSLSAAPWIRANAAFSLPRGLGRCLPSKERTHRLTGRTARGSRGVALCGTHSKAQKLRVVLYRMIICCSRWQVSSVTLSSSNRSGSIPSITISVPSSPARLSQTCASIKSEKSS